MNTKDHSDKPQQVYVGNLHYDATLDDVRLVFGDASIRIGEIRIVKHQDTGRSRGFAFVDIDPAETLSVEEVVSAMDGALVQGRPIFTSPARPRPERESGGNRNRRSDGDHPNREREDRPRRAARGRRTGASVWNDD